MMQFFYLYDKKDHNNSLKTKTNAFSFKINLNFFFKFVVSAVSYESLTSRIDFISSGSALRHSAGLHLKVRSAIGGLWPRRNRPSSRLW